MKYLSLLLFLAYTSFLSAQIPNAGFEDWLPNQACLKPAGWYTLFSEIDSSGTYCPVQRSEEHFPQDQGQYSIRIANDTALWNSASEPGSWLGWGIVFSSRLNDRPLFPVQGKPLAFQGYYLFLPQNNDTLNLRAFLYHNGTEISSSHFRSSTPAPDWTFFRAYFDDTTYGALDSARITLSSANEPKDGSKGPLGNSVLWVDNISFEQSLTAIPELFPAKATAGLNLTVSEKDYLILLRRNKDASSRKWKLRFYDLNGRMLAEEIWLPGASELQLSTVGFPPGLMIRYQDEKFSSSFFHQLSRR